MPDVREAVEPVVGANRAGGATAVQPSSGAMRQVPLATPFGRLAHERGGVRGVILSAVVHAALVLAVVYSGSRLMVADRMPGAGRGRGGGTGSGRGPGMGPDSGGAGGSLYPPTPRQVIMPPSDRPASVRGKMFTILFEISERGDVMRVSINPMPSDHGFARDFLERLRRYRFTPARTLDGRPIAALYPLTITL